MNDTQYREIKLMASVRGAGPVKEIGAVRIREEEAEKMDALYGSGAIYHLTPTIFYKGRVEEYAFDPEIVILETPSSEFYRPSEVTIETRPYVIQTVNQLLNRNVKSQLKVGDWLEITMSEVSTLMQELSGKSIDELNAGNDFDFEGAMLQYGWKVTFNKATGRDIGEVSKYRFEVVAL